MFLQHCIEAALKGIPIGVGHLCSAEAREEESGRNGGEKGE
jgi:hypothetical protein